MSAAEAASASSCVTPQPLPQRPSSEYRLFAQTTQGIALRCCFDVLRENLLDETLVCTPSGIQLIAVNLSKNAMIHLQMPNTMFDVYTCTRKTLMGMCMSNMTRLFKSVTSQDVVTLIIREDDDTNLLVNFENTERVTKFTLRLLDLPERIVDLPAKKFNSVMSLSANDLQKLISNMTNLADSVTIRSLPEGIELRAQGDYVEQITVLMERDTSNVIIRQDMSTMDPGIPDYGSYSLKALNVFTKAACISSTVDMHLKPGLMVLAYQISHLGRLAFLLGPIAETA